MANIKFSQFTQENDAANVDFVVGYVAASNTNVRIAPSQLGVGVYLPLTGGTMTGNTIHNDNVKSIYGTGSDLEIYHDGSNSIIKDGGLGNLYVYSDQFIINNFPDTQNMARFVSGGAATLYYSGNKKFETTNTGVTITGGWVTDGVSVATANIEHLDNVKAMFGNGNDFEIYHDSTTNANIISSLLDRQLQITTNNLFIGNQAASENMITAIADGAVSLYYNNTKRIETVTDGAKVTGNLEVTGTITGTGGSFLPLAGGTMTGDIIFNNAVAETWKDNAGGTTRMMILNAANSAYIGPVDPYGGGAIFYGVSTNVTTQVFYTGGSEKMRLDASGNLGVGMSSGFNAVSGTETTVGIQNSNVASLYLNSTSAGGRKYGIYSASSGQLAFYDFTAATERMRLDSNGNLGIGTNSPTSKLHVRATASPGSYAAYIDNAGGGGNVLKLYNHDWDVGDYLMFATNGGGYNFVIDGNGKVGIGTTNPAEKLEVYGSSFNIKITNTAETDSGIIFEDSLDAAQSAAIKYGSGDNDLKFYVASSVTERMRLNSAGNLGIGTTSPSSPLHIAGTEPSNGVSLAITTGVDDIGLRTSATRLDIVSSTASFWRQLQAGSFVGNVNEISSFVGNVGIGTTTPQSNLVVSDAGASGLEINPVNSQGKVELLAYDRLNSVDRNLDLTADNFKFFTAGSLKMTILNNGNVGIGTTSPIAKIHVKETSTVNTAIFENTGTVSFTAIKVAEAINNKAALTFAVGDALASTDIFGEISGNVTNNGGALSGNLTFKTNQGDNLTEKMRITSAGNLLIRATATPDGTSNFGSAFIRESDDRATLFMATSRSTAAALQIFYNTNGVVGSIAVSGSATTYNTTSDYRLKEDLQDFKGLDLVSKIPVYNYKWKADESRSYGVMAHELQEVLPQAVSGDKDAEEMQSVDYSKIVPLLVKSIQELSAKLESLECQCEKK